MVLCLRRASRGLLCQLRLSDQRSIEEGQFTSERSWMHLMDYGVAGCLKRLSLSFTTLQVSLPLFFFVLSSLLPSFPLDYHRNCKSTSKTRQKPDMTGFRFVFQSYLFCLYTPTPTRPSGPLSLLKWPRSPVNLPGNRSWGRSLL